ncbi:hypothetical protein [Halovivax limisalsi]|uniref:hypothetical protein n=1 Tax=Halovivax limisalsi TaxID=1453760 RepID=UPI001FFD71B0|nr:hypothetical protein [Halovivax limisalsi]
MPLKQLLRQSHLIGRTEWRRDGRAFTRFVSGPAFALALAAIVAWFSRPIASEYAAGRRPLPVNVPVLAVAAFGWVIVGSGQLAHRRFQRLEPALQLQLSSATAVAIGLIAFVYVRYLTSVAPFAVGVAVGVGLGLESPILALWILAAVLPTLAVAVSVGTAGRLLAHHVGKRVIGGRGLVGSLRLVGVVLLPFVLVGLLSTFGDPLFESTGPAARAPGLLSSLIGLDDPIADPFAPVAMGLLVFAASILACTAVTTAVVRRIWLSDPVDSARSVDSRSVLPPGRLDRAFGHLVSSRTLAVIRMTMRLERRNPRTVLYPGYAITFASFVGAPIFALAELPVTLLLVLALGQSVGLVFAGDPIGRSYRALPVLLLSADARSFVLAPIVATTAVASVLVVPLVVLIGLATAIGPLEALLLVFVGLSVATTTASVTCWRQLGVSPADIGPAPSLFSDVVTHGESGLGGFRHLGVTLLTTLLVVLPASLGNASWVTESLAATGIPSALVGYASLVVTIALGAAVTRVATGLACERYRTYELD